jgi:membrane associated rhomboid family serine protease
MSSEMSERAEREDDVWKFSNNNGVLVGADGMLYAYHSHLIMYISNVSTHTLIFLRSYWISFLSFILKMVTIIC